MIAPSRHTPAKDFRKLLPMLPVSSPANDDSGIGAIAAYIKSLNIRPYTVRIRIKDNTQISKLPISVTAHSGILSQKPQSSIPFQTIRKVVSVPALSEWRLFKPPRHQPSCLKRAVGFFQTSHLLIRASAARNQIENFFRKGDDDATRKRQKTVRSLLRVVALER